MARTMALCHPEVEWSAPEDGTTYRGREGVRQRLEEWLESFDDYRYEVQRIIDCGGDDVLVEATEVGRGATSGAEVRSTHYELLTIRDGMIVRIREFYDEGDALEAAGLRSRRCRRRTSRSFGACRTPTTAATWERCSTNSTPRSSGTPGCRFSSAGEPPSTGGTKASARESENLKKPSLRSRQSKQRSGTLASESSPSVTSGDAATRAAS